MNKKQRRREETRMRIKIRGEDYCTKQVNHVLTSADHLEAVPSPFGMHVPKGEIKEEVGVLAHVVSEISY